MWFDDEITGFFNRRFGQDFIESTQSKNVTVYENMADIQSLNRKRTVRIYTPLNYNNTEKRYPVIYMFDAQRLFDNKTAGNRGEEGIDEFLDEMIAEGGKEIMIVAIDNSKNRSTELNPYDYRNAKNNESDKFMEFLVNDLKPMIDSKFRTLPDRENTGIIGASLGGLFSFYTIMNHSEVFSKVGALSPSFLHSEKVNSLTERLSNPYIKIYMNLGGHEFYGLKTTVYLVERDLRNFGFTSENFKIKTFEGGKHEPKVWRDGFKESYHWFFTDSIPIVPNKMN